MTLRQIDVPACCLVTSRRWPAAPAAPPPAGGRWTYHADRTAMVKDYRRYLTADRRPAGRGIRVAGCGPV